MDVAYHHPEPFSNQTGCISTPGSRPSCSQPSSPPGSLPGPKATYTPGERHVILAPGMIKGLPRETDEAVETLRRGGVIAFPTDTVYGLGADAFNPRAVERIYEIKNRPQIIRPLLCLLVVCPDQKAGNEV